MNMTVTTPTVMKPKSKNQKRRERKARVQQQKRKRAEHERKIKLNPGMHIEQEKKILWSMDLKRKGILNDIKEKSRMRNIQEKKRDNYHDKLVELYHQIPPPVRKISKTNCGYGLAFTNVKKLDGEIIELKKELEKEKKLIAEKQKEITELEETYFPKTIEVKHDLESMQETKRRRL